MFNKSGEILAMLQTDLDTLLLCSNLLCRVYTFNMYLSTRSPSKTFSTSEIYLLNFGQSHRSQSFETSFFCPFYFPFFWPDLFVAKKIVTYQIYIVSPFHKAYKSVRRHLQVKLIRFTYTRLIQPLFSIL
jgi:hypothetical protein